MPINAAIPGSDAYRQAMANLAMLPAGCTITNSVGGSANISFVTFQVVDAFGKNLTAPTVLDISLSDATTGAGLTATTASGAVAANTGVDLSAMVAKKALTVQTDATGKYILSITDTAKTPFIPCAVLPTGSMVVGAALTTASYHA